jgi:tripartite-type tricarboxylate transporter receptor subunit TctC
MQEAGLADFEFVIWHGLYAPKGTPQDVVQTLNQALQVALNDDSIKTRFASVGTQVFGQSERTPQAHQDRFQKEVATWKDVITKLGVQRHIE